MVNLLYNQRSYKKLTNQHSSLWPLVLSPASLYIPMVFHWNPLNLLKNLIKTSSFIRLSFWVHHPPLQPTPTPSTPCKTGICLINPSFFTHIHPISSPSRTRIEKKWEKWIKTEGMTLYWFLLIFSTPPQACFFPKKGGKNGVSLFSDVKNASQSWSDCELVLLLIKSGFFIEILNKYRWIRVYKIYFD